MESTPFGTPPLELNAQCLRDQIDYVYSQNPQPITMVSHSMGGVVSRTAIRYLNNQNEVKALYTLGSPHAGLPTDVISILPIACDLQRGACDMSVSHMMTTFNPSNPNMADIAYNFIGGNGGVGKFDRLLKLALQGPNDGLVGQYSAVGWVFPSKLFVPDWPRASQPAQYFTNETHPNLSPLDKAYYVSQDGQGFSDSFGCMDALIKGNTPASNLCWPAGTQTPQANNIEANALSTSVSSFTEIKIGHLNAGQVVTLPFVIDSVGTTLFYLNWSGGNAPSFTLTRPDAQVIDPTYAAAHPNEVTYETVAGSPEAAPNATYDFVSGQVGTWQATITATDAIDYKIFGLIDSTLQLTANTNAEVYQISDNATITANLDSGGTGLSGATVTATLTRSDTVIDVVTLTDQGNGTYTNTYTIPDASGYLTVDITANGNDNGTAFTRQKNLLVAIAPNDLQLTGVYSDTPNDINSDGLYDKLDFTAEVNLAAPGEYAVSAELYAGDQLITQSGDFFPLTAGTQTVTLSFDGRDINKSGLNGPYTVKNLYFTPIDVGITAQSVATAWTTGAYLYTQFVDGVSPVVSNVVRANTNPSNAASVDFTVTFSEPVTDVDSTDFALATTRLTGASITSVTGSGSAYTVTVNTGSGNGTIHLDVVDNNSIVDLALNPLGGAGAANGDFTNGQIYTVIKSATFVDVPLAYWSNSFIERLYNAGIAGGCTAVPLNYCPTNSVTRAQMAVFLVRAMHGVAFVPPTATGVFSDVPVGSFGADFIEQLAADSITSGCGGGNYCPGASVTRAQMAIFLVRAMHGIAFVPPTATGVFSDVPVGSFGADFIEQLAADAITSGCGAGIYCPSTTVKRDSMAVFLVRAFNLP
ncbi:MAG: S-layer homology domain-containing protein [Chloroflexi bacterium]|nr:S-layer homology domain-containing protein [Chloroflexota bacterium]